MDEFITEVNSKTGEHIKYKKGIFLGKGGFATVYELTNLNNNKKYAAKFIAKDSLIKEKHKQKLIQEIKIHRSLNHSNIVQFKHVFEDKQNVYILLEICENKSLSELMRARKRLQDPEVKYFLIQLLIAVKYLHQNNVIHRDLKLAQIYQQKGNILLSENMNLKIGDFGLAAKLQSYEERRKTTCGTPNYLAPEIFDKINGYSFEVDIWSIGIIIYIMLIGKAPFESKDDTYKKVKTGIYKFPDDRKISDDARNLISKILVKDARQRPSIDEILCHNFLQGNIPQSLPQTILSQATLKFTYRHKSSEGKVMALKESTFNRDKSHNIPSQRKSINYSEQQQQLWVVKWIDYSQKYGLGFLLNNGQIGVHFNDQSRIIVMSFIENKFIYINRENKEENFYLGSEPEYIQKKVKLLRYFWKLLLSENPEKNEQGFQKIYIKKWKQTNNAILFRMKQFKIDQNFYIKNFGLIIIQQLTNPNYIQRQN